MGASFRRQSALLSTASRFNIFDGLSVRDCAGGRSRRTGCNRADNLVLGRRRRGASR